VFVVDGDVVKRVSVTLGETRDAERRVISGLADGARLVLSPPRELADGGRISIAADD
jgi:hypothetical protein